MRGSTGRKERTVTFKLKHKAGLLTKILALVLLVYLVSSFLTLRGQIQDAEAERESLTQQVEDQQLENQELSETVENSDDPETLEKVAREKGYVKKDEILIYDVAG